MAGIILFAIWLLIGWMFIFARRGHTATQIAHVRRQGFPLFTAIATLCVLTLWPIAPAVLRGLIWALNKLLDTEVDK